MKEILDLLQISSGKTKGHKNHFQTQRMETQDKPATLI